MPDQPGFPHKRARMIRPGAIGITISADGPEYVMSVAEANELVGLIYQAKHGTTCPAWTALAPDSRHGKTDE